MIHVGDAISELRKLPERSVHCCVTSPPYWGLRDYGVAGQMGLEKTPDEYVARMVEVFREVRRVLRDDGTLWLNLGDCFATGAGKVGKCPGGGAQGENWKGNRGSHSTGNSGKEAYRLKMGPMTQPNRMPIPGLKPKDLVGIPWRVAFALQADGWWLRSEIIWHKPNPMPESVTDRPTKAHEQIFLLAKSERYYYDLDAVKESSSEFNKNGRARGREKFNGESAVDTKTRGWGSHCGYGDSRNRRTVWTVSTKPFKGAHFATFPPDLIEPCIKAGCPADGTVIDPFFGAGTTGLVATKLGRKYVGIELNPEYARMAEERIRTKCGFL